MLKRFIKKLAKKVDWIKRSVLWLKHHKLYVDVKLDDLPRSTKFFVFKVGNKDVHLTVISLLYSLFTLFVFFFLYYNEIFLIHYELLFPILALNSSIFFFQVLHIFILAFIIFVLKKPTYIGYERVFFWKILDAVTFLINCLFFAYFLGWYSVCVYNVLYLVHLIFKIIVYLYDVGFYPATFDSVTANFLDYPFFIILFVVLLNWLNFDIRLYWPKFVCIVYKNTDINDIDGKVNRDRRNRDRRNRDIRNRRKRHRRNRHRRN